MTGFLRMPFSPVMQRRIPSGRDVLEGLKVDGAGFADADLPGGGAGGEGDEPAVGLHEAVEVLLRAQLVGHGGVALLEQLLNGGNVQRFERIDAQVRLQPVEGIADDALAVCAILRLPRVDVRLQLGLAGVVLREVGVLLGLGGFFDVALPRGHGSAQLGAQRV